MLCVLGETVMLIQDEVAAAAAEDILELSRVARRPVAGTKPAWARASADRGKTSDGQRLDARVWLAETLLAWLQAGRNANEVAVRLHVHPQTVRYRLRQLDDLFGDRLQDPDLRFELEIVLRARALLSEDARTREPTEGQVISLRR